MALCVLLAGGAAQAASHSFTYDSMARLSRLGDYDVSRDGKWVVYAVGRADVAKNKMTSSLWLMPADGSAPAHALTQGEADSDPHFSPDGKQIAFVSRHGGEAQIYLIDREGGSARKLTAAPEGLEGPIWSPDGKFLVAAGEVWPECKDLACNQARHARAEKATVKARVIERLLFRHWDHWREGKRRHLFRVDAQSGKLRDLTPGNFDAPVFSLGGRDYDLSPDGKHLVYTSNHDKVEAISTNGDIWELTLANNQVRCLSCTNKAYDGTPRYSPDGKYLAWRAQAVPGFESDEFELVVYDRKSGKARQLTQHFDNWVEELAWAPDSRHLLFTGDVAGRVPLFQVGLDDAAVKLFLGQVSAAAPTVLADGAVIFSQSSLKRAPELWRADARGTHQLTKLNDYAGAAMGEVHEQMIKLSDGTEMQAFVVTPPRFDAHKKHPALLWIHGGPQGAWQDSWSWRWNPQVLASAGYVVLMPNPHGSTGYGQAYVNAVSKDWGGQPYDDLMRATDALEKLPYVDAKRVGAAGASYGGFMINWIQGHTKRFRALFCHDGIADQPGMYATEELWFPEHEFAGPPWKSEQYQKWNPMAFASQFATPELVVGGERDYRVPMEQAFLMFTALQRRGIPSKLLVLPDENHWVTKPGNSRLWYASMVDWFHRYLGGAPADSRALSSAFSVTR